MPGRITVFSCFVSLIVKILVIISFIRLNWCKISTTKQNERGRSFHKGRNLRQEVYLTRISTTLDANLLLPDNLMLVFIFSRRHTDVCLKAFSKVFWVRESTLVSHVVHGSTILQHLAGLTDTCLPDEVERGDAQE